MISPSQKPLPDNTQHSQETDIHAAYGIRTQNLSRRVAAHPRLRPRGHWDRQSRDLPALNTVLHYFLLSFSFHSSLTPSFLVPFSFLPLSSFIALLLKLQKLKAQYDSSFWSITSLICERLFKVSPRFPTDNNNIKIKKGISNISDILQTW